MVKGTASQGVAHASDRCIPCGGGQREPMHGEMGHTEVCAQQSHRDTLTGHCQRVPGVRRILVKFHPQRRDRAKLPRIPRLYGPSSKPGSGVSR